MKTTQPISSQRLSELGENIQILPPDEASPLLLESVTMLLLAGFPDLAYECSIKLIQGELKISEKSLLANSVSAIIPALCYLTGRSCPRLFSQQEMSHKELRDHINRQRKEYERVAGGHFD